MQPNNDFGASNCEEASGQPGSSVNSGCIAVAALQTQLAKYIHAYAGVDSSLAAVSLAKENASLSSEISETAHATFVAVAVEIHAAAAASCSTLHPAVMTELRVQWLGVGFRV